MQQVIANKLSSFLEFSILIILWEDGMTSGNRVFRQLLLNLWNLSFFSNFEYVLVKCHHFFFFIFISFYSFDYSHKFSCMPVNMRKEKGVSSRRFSMFSFFRSHIFLILIFLFVVSIITQPMWWLTENLLI